MIPTIYRILKQIRRNPLNSFLSLFTTPMVLFLFFLSKEYSSENLSTIDYQVFIPRIIILSLVMSLFPVAMAITEELESQCVIHMRMAGMNSCNILLGLAIPYYLIGLLSSMISILFSIVIGLEVFNYPLLIGVVTLGLIPLIGIGILIGSVSKNSLQSFFLSSLVMFLMIIFSGMIFPAPSINIATIFDQNIDAFFFLPTVSIQYIFTKCFSSSESTINRELVYHILNLLLLSFVYVGLAFAIYEKNESFFMENSI